MKRTLALLCLLFSSACTRSSDPRLYTLVAAPSRSIYATPGTIEVRRPTIAGYLDRREIVRAVLSERLELASDANWAEPLDAMFGRVLAADLALRLPNSQVFTDLNTLGVVSASRVDLELQRFEQGPDGLVLHALVALRRGSESTPVAIAAIELQDAAKPSDTTALVAAMNALLGQLADRIAGMVAEPVAGEPR